jgi:hypothetical protein
MKVTKQYPDDSEAVLVYDEGYGWMPPIITTSNGDKYQIDEKDGRLSLRCIGSKSGGFSSLVIVPEAGNAVWIEARAL